jgi:peptidoglycan-N-acetylglucosamine deacetylase
MLRSLALPLIAAATISSSWAESAAPVATPPVVPATPAGTTKPVVATPGSTEVAAPATPEAGAPAAVPVVVEAKAAPITINRCNVEGPYISITFDDGPHGVQTPRLLKMLRDRGIRATFFLVGQCAAEYPEIVKQIVKEGHEVANHSWNHPSLSKMSTESVREQLDRTHNVISQEAEVAPVLMRPPYGNFTVQQRAWAHATWGYRVIMWDVDSLDWKHRSPAKTESIILANTRPGSIILCHDIHKTTVDAMPETLDKLLAKGFKFVTTSELIKMHREPVAPVKAVKTVQAAPAPKLTGKEAAKAATSIEELAKPKAPKR